MYGISRMRSGPWGAGAPAGNKDLSWMGAFMGGVMAAKRRFDALSKARPGWVGDVTAAQHYPTAQMESANTTLM